MIVAGKNSLFVALVVVSASCSQALFIKLRFAKGFFNALKLFPSYG
jgi:hypothetical protein